MHSSIPQALSPARKKSEVVSNDGLAMPGMRGDTPEWRELQALVNRLKHESSDKITGMLIRRGQRSDTGDDSSRAERLARVIIQRDDPIEGIWDPSNQKNRVIAYSSFPPLSFNGVSPSRCAT